MIVTKQRLRMTQLNIGRNNLFFQMMIYDNIAPLNQMFIFGVDTCFIKEKTKKAKINGINFFFSIEVFEFT